MFADKTDSCVKPVATFNAILFRIPSNHEYTHPIKENKLITFTNTLQISNIIALSTVLLVLWSLPSAADLSAMNSRVSELELRQTNSLVYLESRHNNLEAKVLDLLNRTERRFDMLEQRIKGR